MKFELDSVTIESGERHSALARRVVRALEGRVPISYAESGRDAAMPAVAADPFAAGKRRMVILRRRSPFLMACPAGSAQFACCGYLVMVLASNCPMDCSYCFLQEYVADNPGFQIFSNYPEAFDELDRLAHSAPERHFRVGTGELADSLAFDGITEISRDLIDYFARRDNLTLEFKTKTGEIENLLTADPRGRVTVSWTLTTDAIWRSSERRTASPGARIAAARRVLDAGYRVAFHFDPMIAYQGAERDYARLADELLDAIPAARIAFVSMGGLRMTPSLRQIARRRFPADPMLCGEEVLAPDGRLRAFAALRVPLFRGLAGRLKRAGVQVPAYLCMESAAVHERVFGAPPASPAAIGERLAIR